MAREGLESPINSPTRQFGIAPAELGHRLLQQQDPNLFSQWPGEGWNLAPKKLEDDLKKNQAKRTRHWTASSGSTRNEPRHKLKSLYFLVANLLEFGNTSFSA